MQANLTGVIAPLLTPFTSDGILDIDRFEREVQILKDVGVNGMSPGGSAGESAALTDNELATLVKKAKAVAGSELAVVAGVARSSTQAAVQTARCAAAEGADALMVTPTFYNVLVPDDDGNREFYAEIAEATGLPIIAYNVIPQNELSPRLVASLIQDGILSGVKQSSGGMSHFYAMVRECPKKTVYAATDAMLASCYSLGAVGAISAILSLLPRTSVKTWKLVQRGEFEEAFRIQNAIYELWMAVEGPQFPARMKAVVKLFGRDAGEPRRPLRTIDPEEFRSVVEASGILEVERV